MVPIIGTEIRMFQNKKKEWGVAVRIELETRLQGAWKSDELLRKHFQPEPPSHGGGLTGRSVGTWALFPSGYTMFF